MKRIGRISGSKSRQEESDPEREQMRLELRRSFRGEKIGRKVQKHIKEITGERTASESISELLDGDGNPPANAPLESIIKQQRNLTAQSKWLDAWALVFDKKLRQLDEERYWKERQEREGTAERERQERREEKGLSGIDKQDGRAGKLLKSLEEAIQCDYRAASLRQHLHPDDVDARVLGIRRIESGLRCVFSEYIDEKYAAHLSPDEQYELIEEQLTWIGVMAAEIRSKLKVIIEISEAALSVMGAAGRRDGGD